MPRPHDFVLYSVRRLCFMTKRHLRKDDRRFHAGFLYLWIAHYLCAVYAFYIVPRRAIKPVGRDRFYVYICQNIIIMEDYNVSESEFRQIEKFQERRRRKIAKLAKKMRKTMVRGLTFAKQLRINHMIDAQLRARAILIQIRILQSQPIPKIPKFPSGGITGKIGFRSCGPEIIHTVRGGPSCDSI